MLPTAGSLSSQAARLGVVCLCCTGGAAASTGVKHLQEAHLGGSYNPPVSGNTLRTPPEMPNILNRFGECSSTSLRCFIWSCEIIAVCCTLHRKKCILVDVRSAKQCMLCSFISSSSRSPKPLQVFARY